jgi:hypothetical protein
MTDLTFDVETKNYGLRIRALVLSDLQESVLAEATAAGTKGVQSFDRPDLYY